MNLEGMEMAEHLSVSENSSLSMWLLQCKCLLCAIACGPRLFYRDLLGE